MNADEFKSSSGGGRKFLLFTVLLVVAGMVGYDYLVCQPAFREAQAQANQIQNPKRDDKGDAVINKNTGSITKQGDVDEDGVVTPDDVHSFLGKEPSDVDAEFTETTVLETYSWPRGIPFMSQQLFAEYSRTKSNGEERLSLFKVHMTMPESGGTEFVPLPPEERPEGLGMGGGAGTSSAETGGGESSDDEASETGAGDGSESAPGENDDDDSGDASDGNAE